MRRPLALILATLPAMTLAADRDPLAGRVAGAPQTCVNPSAFTQGPQIVDARTILYRDGPRLWRTGPRGTCPGLRPFTTLVVEVFGGRICSGDRFRILEPGTTIPLGPCAFTDFTPYTKLPAAR